MANYQGYLHLTYADVNGDKATDKLPFGPLPDTTTLADLATRAGAIQDAIGGTGPNNAGSATALTNAQLIRAALEIVTITAHVNTGGVGNRPMDQTFPSVGDRATLLLGANTGRRTRITIPAPMDRIFLQPPADDTINLADPAMAALVAAAIDPTNGLKDGGGVGYDLALGGRRSRRNKKRSVNRNYVPSTTVLT